MNPSIYYQGGTLVLKAIDAGVILPAPFQWIKEHWRCEGYHYSVLHDWLRQQHIRDTVPRWEPLDLTLYDNRQPHDYQQAALAAWPGTGAASSCQPARARRLLLSMPILIASRSTHVT